MLQGERFYCWEETDFRRCSFDITVCDNGRWGSTLLYQISTWYWDWSKWTDQEYGNTKNDIKQGLYVKDNQYILVGNQNLWAVGGRGVGLYGGNSGPFPSICQEQSPSPWDLQTGFPHQTAQGLHQNPWVNISKETHLVTLQDERYFQNLPQDLQQEL